MAFRCRLHLLHLHRMQEQAGGGFFLRFDAIRTSSTSLACISDLQGISMLFAHCPPPSHAKASRRWIYVRFRWRSHVFHLPHMQEQAGGGFMAFRHRLYVLHLPRMQGRAGGGFLCHLRLLQLPRMQGRAGGGFLCHLRLLQLPHLQEQSRGGLAIWERASRTKFQWTILLQKYNYIRLAYIDDFMNIYIDPHRSMPQPCYRRIAEAPSVTNTNQLQFVRHEPRRLRLHL